MTPVTVNGITISLIFLIVISMLLPTSSIMYASGQSTDNSDDSSSGGGTTTTDNSGSSSTGGGTTTTSTDNSATLPTSPTTSGNTVNTADLVNSVLTVHNRERAVVGSPPLTWSDTLATSAKAWAEHLIATDKMEHDLESAASGVGENIATFYSSSGKDTDYGQDLWVNEKADWHDGVLSHYGQMIWKNTKEVGCGTASAGGQSGNGQTANFLVCRYTPGIFN